MLLKVHSVELHAKLLRGCALAAHAGPIRRRLTAGRLTLVHPRARGPAHACLGSAAHAHIVRLTCVSRGYRAYSAVRACSTRGQAPLCPDRRPPRPQHPIVSVFRRGGLHFGRHTNQSHARTATKQGELRCERCTVELGPRRGRHQTGGIAPIEARHAVDTPAGCF